MNKPAAITLFAIAVLGIGGYGYIQYDYRNAVADAGEAMHSKAKWCEWADDPPVAQSKDSYKAFCEQYDDIISEKYDVASEKAKLAGVSRDRNLAAISVEYWSRIVADKCDSTSILINGSMPCSLSRSQLDNAEAVLKAQRS